MGTTNLAAVVAGVNSTMSDCKDLLERLKVKLDKSDYEYYEISTVVSDLEFHLERGDDE